VSWVGLDENLNDDFSRHFRMLWLSILKSPILKGGKKISAVFGMDVPDEINHSMLATNFSFI